MEVFLFPLVNVSLFPKTTKPLNIFEPRYLEMVKIAAEKKSPIAIGFIEDASQVGPVMIGETVPYVRPVAGYGFVQIVEERLNGTLLVFLQGVGKVNLGKVVDRGTPFMVVEAQEINEETLVKPESKAGLDHLLKILTRWIYTHIPDPSQQEVFMKGLVGPEEVVGAFSSYLVRDYDLQQMSLEFDDINKKIDFLHRLTESNELTT
ncbi:MAG: LON peptidase substrate-binding domain-containing protein [Bdellovibrionaceae bacterium]|nr:LON peptidase substrate-binding domain-containing protein [Pseudobdellovibrionaceae bacterium]